MKATNWLKHSAGFDLSLKRTGRPVHSQVLVNRGGDGVLTVLILLSDPERVRQMAIEIPPSELPVLVTDLRAALSRVRESIEAGGVPPSSTAPKIG